MAHAMAPLRVANLLLSPSVFVQPLSCYFTSAARAVEVRFRFGMAEAMPYPSCGAALRLDGSETRPYAGTYEHPLVLPHSLHR